MRKVAASAAVFGVVLLAGLALAGEPVDWSKAFERRSDDFDWSRVTNRTTAPPRGAVDWSKAFGKKGQAQTEAQASAPPVAAPAPLEKPRAAAPPSLPTQTLQEPSPSPGPPAPPAQPAGSAPAPAEPAPAPASPPPPPAPAPVPAAPPAPPAAQSAPAPSADVSSPPAPPAPPAQPVGSAPVPAEPALAPTAPPPPPAPAPAPVPAVPSVPPATQAASAPAVPASPAPEPSLVLAPARPEPSEPTPTVPKGEAGKLERTPAAPTVTSPAPVPPAPSAEGPAPAKKAPVQVAAVEQPKPGPFFPAVGYDDAQVAHFLAVALPEPDPKAPARPRMLTRWQGEVRLRVAGRNAARVEALAREAADEIAAALVGSRISLREAEPANLLVFVLPSGPGDAPGYVQNAYDAAAITGSTVVLYADRAGRGAVLRLLLAALGLPGPAPAGQDSVFAAPRPAKDRLTALDRTALELLYSPVLAPGMDQASARQAARSLRRSAP